HPPRMVARKKRSEGLMEWATPLAAFSYPAPDSFLLSNVVCSKLSFKVGLLSINYPALHHGQQDEQQSKRPQRSGGDRDTHVNERSANVQRIAGEAKWPCGDERGGRYSWPDSRTNP